jgi:hypothetical protein
MYIRELDLPRVDALADTVQGKCPRAYHVTCARDTEDVMLKVWEAEEFIGAPPLLAINGVMPPEPERRTIIKTEIYCPIHNPVSHPLLSGLKLMMCRI